MRFWGNKFGCLLVGLCVSLFVGCSTDSSEPNVAGIEVGNPSLAFTADFSVNYSEVNSNSLAKSTVQQRILLDSFDIELSGLRSYSSYYVAVSPDVAMYGLQLWPYESSADTLLKVSFTGESHLDEPFKNIDLKDSGYLKEIGVFLKPVSEVPAIKGRLLVEGEYVPFEYSLKAFEKFGLRYHFSQIETVGDTIANLSVEFYANYFAHGIDLDGAEISKDGIIYIDDSHNESLWKDLNERFVPSFRPLRYEIVNAEGSVNSDYVVDIWEDVIGKMSDNTIENGNFADGLNDWIVFNQFGGESKSKVKETSDGGRIFEIEVTSGGLKSYSVQLIQENVALLANKKYKCVFTIWSNVEGQITARIGTYDDYETIGFQEHVMVSTSGHSVELEFEPKESTPFARFELNLGGAERTFYIRDVKIYRIEK